MNTASQDRPDLDAIRASLQRKLGVRNLAMAPVRTVGNSQSYKVEADGEVLFLKVGPRVAAEALNIERISPPKDPSCRISEIRAFDPELGYIALVYEPGASFLKQLLTGGNFMAFPFRRGVLLSACERIGRWLAKFCEVNVIEDRDITGTETASALQRLRQIRRFLDEPEKERVRRWLNTLSLGSLEIYRANHDLSTRNILIRRDAVAVVDWEKLLERPAYYNLAYLSINIEARSRIPGYSFRGMASLVRRVVASYREADGNRLSADLLALFRKLYIIEYLHGYETKTGVFEPWTHDKKTMDRFIRQRLRPELLKSS